LNRNFAQRKKEGMNKLMNSISTPLSGLFIALAAITSILVAAPVAPGAAPKEPPAAPAVKSMRLDAGGKDYLPLLQGPPETVTMHSGLVVLAPGKSVGRHSTKGNEEIVIVLEGKGEMRFFTGRGPVTLEAGMAAYCPPKTEHDVFNTGDATLKYVYVVAMAGD
jgi:quercetin dioxygenase-like cupin family protein